MIGISTSYLSVGKVKKDFSQGEINLKNLVAKIKKLSPIPPIILEHAASVKEEEILKEKRVLEKKLSI